MKIALLSDWFLPHRGGIEWQMFNLACQLQKEHTVHIITPIAGPDNVGGIIVHRLPGPLFPGLELAWLPRTFHALRRLLEKQQYDVVHIHVSLIAPTSFMGGYISQKLGTPTLLTFHSLLGKERYLIVAVRWFLQIRGWSASFSAVSQLVATDFRAIVNPHPIHILPNSIDSRFWKACPPRRPTSSEMIQLVSVTRFSPRKRTKALIQIFQRVRQERPDIPIHLTIIGTGLAARRLKQMVRRLNLTGDITFTGYLSAEAIREILARSSMFYSSQR